MNKVKEILQTAINKLSHRGKPKKKHLTAYQLTQKYPNIPASQAILKGE